MKTLTRRHSFRPERHILIKYLNKLNETFILTAHPTVNDQQVIFISTPPKLTVACGEPETKLKSWKKQKVNTSVHSCSRGAASSQRHLLT